MLENFPVEKRIEPAVSTVPKTPSLPDSPVQKYQVLPPIVFQNFIGWKFTSRSGWEA